MTRLLAVLATLAVLAPWHAAAAVVPAPAPDAADAAAPETEGVDPVFSYAYEGVVGTGSQPYFNAGTDLAFDGDLVIAPQQGTNGKIHLFTRLSEDEAAAEGAPFRLESTIPCSGGGQNDVAVVRPGLLAVAYHSGRCGTIGGNLAPNGSGVSLYDVSDPGNPVTLGRAHGLPGGTHTLTVHPDGNVIYAAPGGLPTNGGGPTTAGDLQIIDVSNPLAPVVRTPVRGTGNVPGCHDFSVVRRADGDLGVCAGLTETQIWDLDDPLAPTALSRIVNPLIQFHHSATTTSDGKYLVIGDETLAAQECLGGPTGAMFMYDISNPLTPIPQGYFAIDRNAGNNPISAQDRTNWCTAHIFGFIPGTRTMVASWYTGGMNVIDWSNPLAPREVAYWFDDGGTRETTANYWSAYWHDGLVYANDRGRGALDVFEITALAEDGTGGETAPSTRTQRWSVGSIARPAADVVAQAATRAALQRDADAPLLACARAPAACDREVQAARFL